MVVEIPTKDKNPLFPRLVGLCLGWLTEDSRIPKNANHSGRFPIMMQSQQQHMDTSGHSSALATFHGSWHGHRGSLPLKKRRLMMMAGDACMFNSSPVGVGNSALDSCDTNVNVIGARRSPCLLGNGNDEKIAALALVAAASTSAADVTMITPSVMTEKRNGGGFAAVCSPDTPFSVTPKLPIANAKWHLAQDGMVRPVTSLKQQCPAPAQCQVEASPLSEILRKEQNKEQEGTQAPLGRMETGQPASTRHRVHHPPLAAPLPNGCHGRTSRNNSYCRRQPCYNGSNFCKLHFQQYVAACRVAVNSTSDNTALTASMGEGILENDEMPTGIDEGRTSVALAPEEKSSQENKNSLLSSFHPQTGTGAAAGGMLNRLHHHHHQDKRYTGQSGEKQCCATTTRGRPCAYASVNGMKYCHLHADYDTNPPPRRGGNGGSSHGKSGQNSKPSRSAAQKGVGALVFPKNSKVPSGPGVANLGADSQCVGMSKAQNVVLMGPLHVPVSSLSDKEALTRSTADPESNSIVSSHSSLAAASATIGAKFEANGIPTQLTSSSDSSCTSSGFPTAPCSSGGSLGSGGKEQAKGEKSPILDFGQRQHSLQLLSSISSDQWSKKRVLISTGPLTNHTGHVTKWGNGWVTVCTSTGSGGVGEGLLHNRRAVELLVLPDQEGKKIQSDQIESFDPGKADVKEGPKEIVEEVCTDCVTVSAELNGSLMSDRNVEPGHHVNSDNTPDISWLKLERQEISSLAPNAKQDKECSEDLPKTTKDTNLKSPCDIKQQDEEEMRNGTIKVATPSEAEQRTVSHTKNPKKLVLPKLSSSECKQKNNTQSSEDDRTLSLVESLRRAQEGRGGRRHNFDLLFGTAALERSRRTIHKPERYEDKAMIEKDDKQHQHGHARERVKDNCCCPAKS